MTSTVARERCCAGCFRALRLAGIEGVRTRVAAPGIGRYPPECEQLLSPTMRGAGGPGNPAPTRPCERNPHDDIVRPNRRAPGAVRPQPSGLECARSRGIP